MKGADYVAVVRITDRAGKVTAAPGASCEHVPAESLSWLLEAGAITPRTKARSVKAAPPEEGKE